MLNSTNASKLRVKELKLARNGGGADRPSCRHGPLGLALAGSPSPLLQRHDGGLERAGKAGRAGVDRIDDKALRTQVGRLATTEKCHKRL